MLYNESIDVAEGVFNPQEPELYRDQFPYSSVPKVLFDGISVSQSLPESIWLTDTTFRDGQQARPPYTPEQIQTIYRLLGKLNGNTSLIRQSEFFLYSDRDREALDLCLDEGIDFPEITGWIRANTADLELVKQHGLKETGILTSVSDYHIYLKLRKNRVKALDEYLGIVKEALSGGIIPRCHFEDVTRADVYGFCVPFARELMKLSREAGFPVKIRLCDTLGYGIPFSGVKLPRSIPKLVHAFRTAAGVPSEWLEWHGHNDFHKVHGNGVAAWLFGVSALNTSLFGFGERTGNPPLEGAVIEYLGLTDSPLPINTQVITELADYFKRVIKVDIPANYPFVGADFNTTRAGIHADGILKNQEIYNIFDTAAILNRPLKVTVTDKSGHAGIARWLNENIESIHSGARDPLNKRHPGIRYIHEWVIKQYEQGRTTAISPEELIAQTRHFIPSLFESDFDTAQNEAKKIAVKISEQIHHELDGQMWEDETMKKLLRDLVKREGAIQFLAIADLEGNRISEFHTQVGEKGRFRNLSNKDFRKKEWFRKVIETGEPFYSDLFFSRFTKRLILTSAHPFRDNTGTIVGIIDIDFRFDELTKLITPIPDEILDR